MFQLFCFCAENSEPGNGNLYLNRYYGTNQGFVTYGNGKSQYLI